jgi:hypothetical protein
MRTRNIHLFIRSVIILIAGGVIFGYAYFRAEPYLNGPQVTVAEPQNGITVHESPISITGTVERISSLHLNGQKIFIDKDGVFNETVHLHSGYNIITVEAIDRFDKRIKKQLQIIYKET